MWKRRKDWRNHQPPENTLEIITGTDLVKTRTHHRLMEIEVEAAVEEKDADAHADKDKRIQGNQQ